MFIGKNKNGFYYIHFKNINTGKYNKVTTKKKLKADAHRVLIEFQLKYQKELEKTIESYKNIGQ
jgi:molybdate-binding protein